MALIRALGGHLAPAAPAIGGDEATRVAFIRALGGHVAPAAPAIGGDEATRVALIRSLGGHVAPVPPAGGDDAALRALVLKHEAQAAPEAHVRGITGTAAVAARAPAPPRGGRALRLSARARTQLQPQATKREHGPAPVDLTTPSPAQRRQPVLDLRTSGTPAVQERMRVMEEILSSMKLHGDDASGARGSQTEIACTGAVLFPEPGQAAADQVSPREQGGPVHEKESPLNKRSRQL